MTKNESKLNVNVTFKGHIVTYAGFFWMIQNTENIGCFFCLSLHCRPLHLACLVYHTNTAAASILKTFMLCFSALLKSPVALYRALQGRPGRGTLPFVLRSTQYCGGVFGFLRLALHVLLRFSAFAASQFYRWRIKLRGQNHFSFAQQQWCFPSTSQNVSKRLFSARTQKKICWMRRCLDR